MTRTLLKMTGRLLVLGCLAPPSLLGAAQCRGAGHGGSSKAAWSSTGPGRYAEALKDFQTVAEGYATSTVADDAMLAIAEYQLDVLHDPIAARTSAETLVKRYATGDAAPMGYVIAGRSTLALDPSPVGLDSALASFDRVPRLFPRSEAVAPVAVLRGRDRSPRRPRPATPSTSCGASRSPIRGRRGRRVRACSSRRCCWPTASRRKPCAPCSASCGATAPAQKRRRRGRGTPRSTGSTSGRRRSRPTCAAGRSIAGPTGKLKDVESIAIAPDGKLGVATRTGFLLIDREGRDLAPDGGRPTRARSPSTIAAGCSWCRRRSSGARPTRAWRGWR